MLLNCAIKSSYCRDIATYTFLLGVAINVIIIVLPPVCFVFEPSRLR